MTVKYCTRLPPTMKIRFTSNTLSGDTVEMEPPQKVRTICAIIPTQTQVECLRQRESWMIKTWFVTQARVSSLTVQFRRNSNINNKHGFLIPHHYDIYHILDSKILFPPVLVSNSFYDDKIRRFQQKLRQELKKWQHSRTSSKLN